MDKVDQSCELRRTFSSVGIILCCVGGWLAAVASLVKYPFIFGLVAIILGIRISKGGSRAGMPLVAASIMLMAIGLMFNNTIYDYLKNAMGV